MLLLVGCDKVGVVGVVVVVGVHVVGYDYGKGVSGIVDDVIRVFAGGCGGRFVVLLCCCVVSFFFVLLMMRVVSYFVDMCCYRR